MNMDFTYVTELINSAGLAVGVFLAIVILGFKKSRKQTKILLSVLVAAITLSITWCKESILPVSVTHYMIGFVDPVYFTIGPLLYLYVSSVTNNRFKMQKKHILHFTPSALALTFNLPVIFMPVSEKLSFVTEVAERSSLQAELLFITQISQILIYLVFSLNLLKIHEDSIKNYLSSLEETRMRWLKLLVYPVFVLYIGDIAVCYLGNFIPEKLLDYREIFSIKESLLVFIVGYKGLIQPDIFSSDAINSSNEKYRASKLTDSMAEEYLARLIGFVEQEKPYTDPGITLKMLSEKVSIPPRYLSQVMNDRLGRNFYEFINGYRVEEVKKRLLNGELERFTILAIAYDVGFNSKTTFNTVFKKQTGLSPTQYIKSMSKKPVQVQ